MNRPSTGRSVSNAERASAYIAELRQDGVPASNQRAQGPDQRCVGELSVGLLDSLASQDQDVIPIR